ncbi:MAG TPA: YceI family protein [Elusimicrobiota bacterium]|jgi:polyisoprenoid-binding protein YceI|nr:YceI family protein [Elusimicrobiota bacterium]
MRQLLLAAAALAVLTSAVRADEYEIDPAHSSIGFLAKHIVGKVPGRFTKFSGEFAYVAGDTKAWKAEAEIDPASIDTDTPARDKDLRSDRFFDVEKCPKMTFKSTGATGLNGDEFKLHGNLTMHCVTKPVVLDVEFNGLATDPWGNKSASFSAKTTLDRKDWGIDWNKTLDSGGVLVGDKVELDLEISGNLKKPAGR